MLIMETKPSTGMALECWQDGMATAHVRLEHVIEHIKDKTKKLHLIRNVGGKRLDA